jgi:3-methylfumaryl-CoA hydratase
MRDDVHSAVGRSETASDLLTSKQARLMQVTLDRAPDLQDGDPLPPFWHYLYFNPELRAADLGQDGHERLGRFIPDFGLPRRMWAGGRVEIAKPLLLGETAERHSTIRKIEEKTGRSGRLCFVTLDHDFSVAGEHRLRETQTIVYREMPDPDAPAPPLRPAPETCAFSRTVTPDPVLLFRYSALIFFGHRIHYDADYTLREEGYPGLVFHGPLTATLLVELGLAHLPGARLTGFDIRALAPLFVTAPFRLEGRRTATGADLWARTPDGGIAMTVTLQVAA